MRQEFFLILSSAPAFHSFLSFLRLLLLYFGEPEGFYPSPKRGTGGPLAAEAEGGRRCLLPFGSDRRHHSELKISKKRNFYLVLSKMSCVVPWSFDRGG